MQIMRVQWLLIFILMVSASITLGKQSWLKSLLLIYLPHVTPPDLFCCSLPFCGAGSLFPLSSKVAFRQLGHSILQCVCSFACLLHSTESPAGGASLVHCCAFLIQAIKKYLSGTMSRCFFNQPFSSSLLISLLNLLVWICITYEKKNKWK